VREKRLVEKLSKKGEDGGEEQRKQKFKKGRRR